MFRATWGTLMAGQFIVNLSAHPPGLVGICSGVTPSHGNVAEMWLIIEGVFPSPISPSTWGQVKALLGN
jgi:hypothetical protein